MIVLSLYFLFISGCKEEFEKNGTDHDALLANFSLRNGDSIG